jgi:ParB-like chromosome segregation protein Spo0J
MSPGTDPVAGTGSPVGDGTLVEATAASVSPPPPADVERVAAAMNGADVVELIPLEHCAPAPYNPRTFGPKPSPALLQLALSIRRTGQVQPATVRRKGDAYEIVCGERRWRACCLRAKGEAEMVTADAWVGDRDQAAELTAAGPPPTHLRAVVRELTDEQAMEICAVENLEREDLAPLEEAAGVATLLQLYRGDVEAVASRLRRPVSWVAARVRLNTLSPKWRAAIAKEDSGFHTWTAAHLCEVAKLAVKAQDVLLERFRYEVAGVSVKEIRDEIGRSFLTLGLAPFDVEDAALVPKVGACATCPTTSASTPGLFADEGDEIRPSELRKARCLNPGCWSEKLLAHAKQQVHELRKKHGDAALVAEHRYHAPSELQGKLREVGSYGSEYVRAKEGAKGAWPGVHVAGEKLGQVEWFTKRPKGSSSKGGRTKTSDSAAGVESKPTPLKDRRAALDRRRKVLAVSLVADAVKASKAVPTEQDLLALALAFGTKLKADTLSLWYWADETGAKRAGDRWGAFDAALAGLQPKASDTARQKVLAGLWQHQILPVLLSRLNYQGSHTDVGKLWADACRTAGLAQVDHAALLAKAVEELPEPKSWVALARQEKEARKAKAKATGGAKTTTSAAKANGTSKPKPAAPSGPRPRRGRRPAAAAAAEAAP